MLSYSRGGSKKRTSSTGSSRVSPASSPEKGSRYIPSPVRERVLERAGYQCEWTGTGGVRCSARAGLEIDHIRSYAKGGGRNEANLRVLCQAHNLFSAGREFGEAFMRGKIERAPASKDGEGEMSCSRVLFGTR